MVEFSNRVLLISPLTWLWILLSMWSETVLLKPECVWDSQGILSRCRFYFYKSGLDLKVCVSNMLPGESIAANPGATFWAARIERQRYLALFSGKKSVSLDLGLEPLLVKSGANCSSISLGKISYCICESRCQFWVFHKLWLLLRISQLGDMITDNFSERNDLRWTVSILIFTKRSACLLLTQKALCSRVAPFWWNSWCQRWVCKPC